MAQLDEMLALSDVSAVMICQMRLISFPDQKVFSSSTFVM